MIFKLDNSITTVPETNFVILAEMALDVARNEHYFVVDDFRIKEWFYDNIIDNSSCFSPVFRDLIQRRIDLFSPTKMLQGLLRSVNVGYQKSGMLSPKDVVKIINTPSYVVLENSTYDWSVFLKWSELYFNHDTEIRTLSQILRQSVKKGKIIPLNGGGGNGSIANALKSHKPIIGNYFPLKYTTIFDSDKVSSTDPENHNVALISYLGTEGLRWHELYKREIENYFPFDSYKAAGLIVNQSFLNSLNEAQWDYNDFSSEDGKCGVKMQKRDVLALCGFLSYEGLKSRFWNGKDECVEIMNLLVKYI